MHDKNSGSGLGLQHAIKTIEALGGALSIESTLNQGTCVTIKLPHGQTPHWFVKAIDLRGLKTVVILDDDQSIHDLWRNRFSHHPEAKLELLFFSASTVFTECCNTIKKEGRLNSTLFLLDYELIKESVTGLDLIEQLNIAHHFILVTSHYEDSHIKERAAYLGLCMIPKGIAGFAPFVQ